MATATQDLTIAIKARDEATATLKRVEGQFQSMKRTMTDFRGAERFMKTAFNVMTLALIIPVLEKTAELIRLFQSEGFRGGLEAYFKPVIESTMGLKAANEQFEKMNQELEKIRQFKAGTRSLWEEAGLLKLTGKAHDQAALDIWKQHQLEAAGSDQGRLAALAENYAARKDALEKKYWNQEVDTYSAQKLKLAELKTEAIRDELERSKAMINLKYDYEIRKAREAYQDTEILQQQRAQELLNLANKPGTEKHPRLAALEGRLLTMAPGQRLDPTAQNTGTLVNLGKAQLEALKHIWQLLNVGKNLPASMQTLTTDFN